MHISNIGMAFYSGVQTMQSMLDRKALKLTQTYAMLRKCTINSEVLMINCV